MNATRTGLAIASLAALATLTACGNATDGDDKASKENTGTPTASAPTQTPSGTPKPGVIDLTKLEQGEEPQVAWLLSSDVRYAGGGEVGLPGDGYDQLVQLGESWLVTNIGEADAEAVLLDHTGGEQLGAWPIQGSLVINAEGTAAAWVSDTGIPLVLEEGSTRPTQLPELGGAHNYSAVALVDDTVFVSTTHDDGASSFQSSTRGGTTEAASHTITHGADAYGDADGIRLVGHTSIQDDGSCSALTGPQSDSPEWETCDFSIDAFSADGSLLLAGPAYRDGFGDKEIAILAAADGEVVAQPEVADAASITSTTWEDADSVLATVYQDGEWAIVRINTDGSVELATAPAAGSEEQGYRLALS